ncbi:diphthamide biosynthesis enzyme Dph1/Dph2 domain protein [Leishmania donovani]|uniref:Diphthamide biosynthesis enzyme Dph1/Dph2 domain protein n=1 Tax=Leishmania donovani TaxID=5661 RepID=A0A504XYK0_LEIDO|nr:diphthamide biosynthesis enzyme Dph1/Dph2 domain protein [Leishmania donovani]
MYHDAPVEAAVVVHRHRQRRTASTLKGDGDEGEAERQIIEGYQLHRVADFLLSGATHGGEVVTASAVAVPTAASGGGLASLSCQLCSSTAAVPSRLGLPYMRVALQFPDELLGDAVAVVHCLSNLVATDQRYVEAMEFKKVGGVVRDESKCCIAGGITAQHYTADCIVHFGEACMSRSTRLPVFYVQPVFHFSALATGAVAGSDAVETLLDAEAALVLEVVRQVASAIRHRLTNWWAEKAEATGASAGAPCPVRPRIAIVGTYPTKAIVQAAERRWSTTEDSSVPISWPIFEERCLSVAAELAKLHGAEASGVADAGSTSSGVDCWVVNGVRFPRVLFSSSSAPSHEVQYLLFIGAVGSSALVHVLTAEQYNQFHYSDLCREYLAWDGGAEVSNVPVVCVLDNCFGDTAETKEQLHNVSKCLAGAGASLSGSLELTDAVHHWVSAACADGVAAALVTEDGMRAQQTLQRRMRQRAFNIECVRASSAIGILVASLAIEGYYEVTQQLHQLLRAYGKRSYMIYVGHLNEFKLANFLDAIDCFVAVACPHSRQSHFTEKRDGFMKPIVSPAEVLVALTSADDTQADEQYGMAAVYTTCFQAVLPLLKRAVQARRSELESRAGGTDADTQQRQNDEEERWTSSGALVRASTGSGGGALIGQGSSQGALARLHDREYVGLDPRVGQTPVQAGILEGKHGIALGYAKEREGQGVLPRSGSTALSAWRTESTEGKVHSRGHANSGRHKLALRSPSQCKQLAQASSTVVANATTSVHPNITHERGGQSSSVDRCITPAVTTTPRGRGAETLVRSGEQALPHLLVHPAALTALQTDTDSVGAAAALDGKLSGRRRGSLRTGPGEPVSARVFSVSRSRSTGVASALLNSGASGLLGAGSSGGTAGATLYNYSGKSFGGVGTRNQNRCSHCKVAEEVLYRCPCGLARYCCTICQHAHWPFHKAVCCHAVRAIRPPTRHCDWCRTPSQTLRQCGCGFAYYCDTHCQRADWSYHCIVCSTEASTTLAAALVGGRALRARREAATQTAHWQISAPVIRPTGRGDGTMAAENATGMSARLHASLHERHSRSGSDGEDNTFSGSCTRASLAAASDAEATPQVSPRRRSHVRAASEHGSQVGVDSGSGAFATLHQNRETPVRASNYADPGGRTTTSTQAAIAGGDMGAGQCGVGLAGMNSRSTLSHHNATGTLYKSRHINTSATQQHWHNPLLDGSRAGGPHSLRLSQPGEPNHGAADAFLQHQHHQSSLLTDHHRYVSHASQLELIDRSLFAMAGPTIRDQPGVVAFLVASRHIVEKEEISARAALFRKFRLGCVGLQMRVLGKREEEERMTILKEEVLWCVLTGHPAWKKLTQELQRFREARK